MPTPEIVKDPQLQKTEKLLRPIALLWVIFFYTLPLDLLCLSFSAEQVENGGRGYFFLLPLLLVALFTANHDLVLKSILWTKEINLFFAKYRKKVGYVLIIVVFIVSITMPLYQVYYRQKTYTVALFQFVGYLVIAWQIYDMMIKRDTSDKGITTTTNLSLEQIQLICMARIVIPKILSIGSAVLCLMGLISQRSFIGYFTIAAILIINAKPEVKHFLTQCRACGKKTQYGSNGGGYCDGCRPTPFKMPEKFVPKTLQPPRQELFSRITQMMLKVGEKFEDSAEVAPSHSTLDSEKLQKDTFKEKLTFAISRIFKVGKK